MKQTQAQFRDEYRKQASQWREMAEKAPADIAASFIRRAEELEREAARAMTPKFKELFCR